MQTLIQILDDTTEAQAREWWPWLYEATTEGAKISRCDCHANCRRLIWRGGEFRGGEFSGGVFSDGVFSGGFMMPVAIWTSGVSPTGRVKIGCKEKSIPEWDEWFASDDVYSTKRGTEQFKRIHAQYLALRAYAVAMGYAKDS